MTTLPTTTAQTSSRLQNSGNSEGQLLHNMNVRANEMRRRGLSASAGRLSNPRVLRQNHSVVA